jgi:hypothetical protein
MTELHLIALSSRKVEINPNTSDTELIAYGIYILS